MMLAWSVAVLFCRFLELCRLFSALNSWGAAVAPQAYWPCHLGIDNLNVASTIGPLLDKDCLVKPLPLVKDGDLVALVQYMIRTRGRETVRVTKVKGHAEDADVQSGRVRLEDQLGNAEAEAAADLGLRHEDLIDAWRRLLKVRSHWYPVVLQLHRFMIAVARVTVNHDGRGGTAPDPLVRDQGSRPKARKLAIGLILILQLCLALLVSWVGPGCRFMKVVLLVLILLPDLTVLAFFVNLLLFLELCIGLLVPMVWVILGFPF